MKQLIQMFIIDLKMNFKSFMGSYVAIVPMLALVILRSFLPSVESTTVTFAVVNEGPNAVDQQMIDELDEFANIEAYSNIKDMENKLRGTGSAEGLYWDPEAKQYVSVLERSLKGNKIFSVASRYYRQRYLREHYPGMPRVTEFSSEVPEELSDRTKISPVATMGGAIFIVFLTIMLSFIIGLGVVMDKEFGTDKAIRVTPVSKVDYFIGKSIYPALVILVYTIVSLMMLGLMQVNILQVYMVVLVSFPSTMLFGLLIGALGKNEMEAMGLGKLLSTVIMLSILGGTLLSDSWMWIIWWSPFYWIYAIIEEVYTGTATWGGLSGSSAIIISLTLLYFILFRKKIIEGLS